MTAFKLLRTASFGFAAILAAMSLASCGASSEEEARGDDEHEEAELERGPHGGRLLRDGDIAVELTIFEDGVLPEFRIYPYKDDKPLDPASATATVELSRLGGKVDRFSFNPQEDFLRGDGVVEEPHSFDVKIDAEVGGKTASWTYPSYEGRTTIGAKQAEDAGVKVEAAGPAVIEDIVTLSGRIELQPEGRAEASAWFPGRIVEMTKRIGEAVEKGETLAKVTSSDSLETYSIPAPIAGIVMQRNANAGDVAGEAPIYVIADARQVHAEFYVYPHDAESLRAGQPVIVKSLDGDRTAKAEIAAVLPTADLMTQTIVAHVLLANDDIGWRPGQAIEGAVAVAQSETPLAVRTRALQRFRDFTVVFARVGDTYEVRMIELGRSNPEWTEVLGGLSAGDIYVTDNSFLIRADIEKSGASHDH